MDGQGSSRGDPDLPGGAPTGCTRPCVCTPFQAPPPHSSEHLILWFFQDSKNKKAKKGKRQ